MVGLVDRLASPSIGLSSDPNAANEGKGHLVSVRSEVESVAYLVVGASQALEDGVDGDSRRWLTALGATGDLE